MAGFSLLKFNFFWRFRFFSWILIIRFLSNFFLILTICGQNKQSIRIDENYRKVFFRYICLLKRRKPRRIRLFRRMFVIYFFANCITLLVFTFLHFFCFFEVRNYTGVHINNINNSTSIQNWFYSRGMFVWRGIFYELLGGNVSKKDEKIDFRCPISLFFPCSIMKHFLQVILKNIYP